MTVLRIARRGVLNNHPGRIEIDRTNPDTRGLLEFTIATPNGLISSSGAASVNLGVTRLAAFAARPGVGRRSNAVSSASAESVAIDLGRTRQDSPITLYCRGMLGGTVIGGVPTSFALCRNVYGITPDTTATGVLGIGISAGATLGGSLAVGGNFGASRNTGDIVVGNNVVSDAFGASSGGASAVFSLDVIGVGTATPSASFGAAATVLKPCIAVTGINLSSSGPGDKILFYGAVWNRMLSADERRRVAENPRGLIKSVPWILLAPGAGASFNPAWAIGSNVVIGAGAIA